VLGTSRLVGEVGSETVDEGPGMWWTRQHSTLGVQETQKLILVRSRGQRSRRTPLEKYGQTTRSIRSH
jgi:hypothetical protein